MRCNTVYTYSDVIEFATWIDDACGIIISMEQDEAKKLENLTDARNTSNWNVEELRRILGLIANSFNSTSSLDSRDNVNIKSLVAQGASINISNLLKDYKTTTNQVLSLQSAIAYLEREIPRTEKTLKMCFEYVKEIEGSPGFAKWVKSSEKYLHKFMLPKDPPTGLSEVLIDNELGSILYKIAHAGSVFENADVKLRYAFLYRVYRNTIEKENSIGMTTHSYIQDVKDYLSYLKSRLVFLKSFLEKIQTETKNCLSAFEERLIEDQNNLDAFPNESEINLRTAVAEMFEKTCDKMNSQSLRAMLYSLHNSDVDWHTAKVKEKADEKYLFSEHRGILKHCLNDSPMIKEFLEMVVREYDYLLKVDSEGVYYHFPEIINVNTSEFNYIIEATKVCDKEDKRIINSLVQNFVASTISNFPPGKVKFLFCDPDSTGVFSVFRDIGKIKDDVDDSISCEYAGSAETITKKLDSICVEIDDIVNKVIKGTTTTLFDHNRDNEFNSMPYRFVMLMDFPRNMTPASLSSLRSILKNGPRCGIFTVLVNIGGEALSFLDEKMQVVVKEIVKSPSLVFSGKSLLDVHQNEFGSFTEELNPLEFDIYVKEYNKRQKDNEGFRIEISSLEASEVKGGGYSIPVGRSKGGKIETIAFFDHCQNYLLSGAIGRGKSNALHVIIHNSLKYIKDLDLYLIDFKHGVEFAPYARINHPAFKVLAIESAPEFGYSVLTHINDKIARIGEIFRENGVENWTELYKKTGRVIPVTLIIMDEFQHLFEGEHGKQCSEIIEFIAKEGRVFNVHLFLSSQTVNNMSGLTEAAKQMIFGRIVFFNDQVEYKAMLWDDDKLARTFDPDIKGQAILATGKEHQRFVQFALKKPIEETIAELSCPEDVVNRTKIMLSAVHENPYSIYNQFLNGNMCFTDDCELVIGDDITIDPSDIKQRVEDESYTIVARPDDVKSIQLKHRQNDNVLVLGNEERKAETIFMFNLLCVLMKQMSQKKTNSISLIMVTTATDLYNLAMKFPKYIKIYTTSDLLNDAVTANTDYLFVFGLHAFTSMKYSVDDPYKKVNNVPQFNGGVIIGDTSMPQDTSVNYATDGEMLRSAIDRSTCNTIIWHNDAENLANMFGTTANFPIFNNKFLHKICLPMSAKDSELFIGTDSGSKLSENAIVYKFLNNEKILRMYNRFEPKYLNRMISKLEEVSRD